MRGATIYRMRARLTAAAQLPYFPQWLALGTMALVALSLVLAISVGGRLPAAAVVLTALISALCLLLVRLPAHSDQGFMRIGFHAGVVAFFLLMPLLFPTEMAERIPSDTRDQIDLILILSVVGFEVGYWLRYVVRVGAPSRTLVVDSVRSHPRLLVRVIVVGVGLWGAYEMAFARSVGTSVTDVLLAMRNPIEGAGADLNFVWRYGSRVAMAMLFAAGTAGGVVVTDRRASTSARAAGWGAIACLTVVGFLTGSRGYFLFASVPAAVACWFSLRRLPKIPGLQPVILSAAAAGLVVIWFVMSAVRDVGRIEDRLDSPLVPMIALQGAFDIYSQMAVVVESVPRVIDYQYGASAVPVVFGWVPRTVWPQKPYPFSLVMTHLAGEDLDWRTASLTPGLPAEGFGNFGVAGVLLWVLVMGVFCRSGDDYLRRIGIGNAFGLQLAGIWCIWAAMIARGGVAEMFYMGLEITLAPVALTLYALTRTERSRQRVPFRIPRRRLA